MSLSQGSSSLKRKRQESNAPSQTLSNDERRLYDVIRSKKDMGIWTRDLKRETQFPDSVVTKSLRSLQTKKLIKEVVNIQNKARKHYMAAEFEPSAEIVGGAWYVDGKLDTDFIKILRDLCYKHIQKLKLATLEDISNSIKRSGVFKAECTMQQIAEIVNVLVLENEITEEKSTGYGDFERIPIGTRCYRCTRKGGPAGEAMLGAMASIPCGVCPQISMCTPDGIISPITCAYYDKWLDF
ncbi:probable DNA-directed RNA polymerase III subunit rpc6 isoform X1 [Malania oleifera]|nr:probable DNA-directed RNA polymerase III subunit rpc6 isoform X1 [Malania oleifera]XP_057967937.1 probable DNA-directed RNA polymerase III subunit rpc6 isoform X1 [Malania oleifera]XP_057967938.1 probable DNA-directed RNA polymerase III subunit rpc6 isoform X1 [Malania oleifera]